MQLTKFTFKTSYKVRTNMHLPKHIRWLCSCTYYIAMWLRSFVPFLTDACTDVWNFKQSKVLVQLFYFSTSTNSTKKHVCQWHYLLLKFKNNKICFHNDNKMVSSTDSSCQGCDEVVAEQVAGVGAGVVAAHLPGSSVWAASSASSECRDLVENLETFFLEKEQTKLLVAIFSS